MESKPHRLEKKKSDNGKKNQEAKALFLSVS